MQETKDQKSKRLGRRPKVAIPSKVELELHLHQRRSTAQIAKSYGVSRFVVFNWLRVYDLTPAPRKGGKKIDWQALDPKIRELFPAKISTIQHLSDRLGVSYGRLKIRLIHLGLLQVKKGAVFDWTQIDADVKRFTQQGISLRSIAIGKGIKFKSLRSRYPEHMLQEIRQQADDQKMAAD